MDKDKKELTASNGHERNGSTRDEAMNNLSVEMNNLELELRQNQVFELYSKHHTQIEIAEKLGISQPTVSRHIKAIEEKICMQRKEWGDKHLIEHEKYLAGMQSMTKSLWEQAEKENIDLKDKLKIISLIIRCCADIRKAIAEEPAVLSRRNYLNKIMSKESEQNIKNKRMTDFEGISNEDLGLPKTNIKI